MNLNRLSEGMILEILDTVPSRKLYDIACTSQWMWDLVRRMKPRDNDLPFLCLRFLLDRSETNIIAIMQFPNSLRHIKYTHRRLFCESKYFATWCLDIRSGDLFTMENEGDITSIKIALAQNGNCLQFLSAEFRGDIECVKLAVAKSGDALAFASDELKSNIEIVKIAVT